MIYFLTIVSVLATVLDEEVDVEELEALVSTLATLVDDDLKELDVSVLD